jgi:hypothetical protein
MNFNNEVVVGDFENGNIYAFDLDVYSDDTAPQKWLRSWRALPTGENTLRRTAQHTLQLDCETGFGYVDAALAAQPSYIGPAAELLDQSAGTAIDFLSDGYAIADADTPPYTIPTPQVMLRWSDDGGHTWSREHWASLGAQGQYGKRVFWRRLGMTQKLRDRVYEVSGTDPTKIIILGAELIVDGTAA